MEVTWRRLEICTLEVGAIEGAGGMLDEPVMDAVVAKGVVAGRGEGLSEDVQADRTQDLLSGRGDEVIEGRAREGSRGGAHPADHSAGHCSSPRWRSVVGGWGGGQAGVLPGWEEGGTKEGGRGLVCGVRTGHKVQRRRAEDDEAALPLPLQPV